MRSNRYLLASVLACLIFFSCTRTTEEFTTPHLYEYFPVQIGKYITYRLDSTVFINFGSVAAVHSYQEKQVIDAKIPDGLGRDTYRILRFLRDTAGTQPWISAGSYFITPTDSVIEVNENNLRIIKLVVPITQDNTWKGNRYLPDDAYAPLYSFNNDFRMNDWDYTYSSIDGSLTAQGQTYNDVITVDGIDMSFNADVENASVLDPNTIAYVNYLRERYAKGLGLITQQLIMWEYQPPNAASPSGAQVGFGVKRTIIDHN